MTVVELLTRPEAAARLAVSLRTLDRLISSGQIRVLHIGQPGSRKPATRVKASELAAYIAHLEGRRVA